MELRCGYVETPVIFQQPLKLSEHLQDNYVPYKTPNVNNLSGFLFRIVMQRSGFEEVFRTVEYSETTMIAIRIFRDHVRSQKNPAVFIWAFFLSVNLYFSLFLLVNLNLSLLVSANLYLSLFFCSSCVCASAALQPLITFLGETEKCLYYCVDVSKISTHWQRNKEQAKLSPNEHYRQCYKSDSLSGIIWTTRAKAIWLQIDVKQASIDHTLH